MTAVFLTDRKKRVYMSFKSDFPFRAQGMFDRFAKFAEAFTTLSDLSLRLSCPLHCSSSCLPWFLAVSVANLLRPGHPTFAGGDGGAGSPLASGEEGSPC